MEEAKWYDPIGRDFSKHRLGRLIFRRWWHIFVWFIKHVKIQWPIKFTL